MVILLAVGLTFSEQAARRVRSADQRSGKPALSNAL
jgi:hypothetical protein